MFGSFRQNKYLKNEHGLSLFIVLLVLVVVSIMGISLMGMAASNVKMSTSDREYQSTFYIAEAGANKVMSEIKIKLEELYNDIQSKYKESEREEIYLYQAKVLLNGFVLDEYKYVNAKAQTITRYDNFSETFNEEPYADVAVKEIGANEYALTSAGIIGNRTRTVETTFKVEWASKGPSPSPIFNDRVVYSDSCIILEGSASIVGNVGLNGNLSSTTKCTNNSPLITISGGNNDRISGNIYISKEAQNNEIKLNDNIKLPNPDPIKTDPINYKEMMPQFPVIPSFELAKDKQIVKNDSEKYNVIYNGKLRIDNYLTDQYQLDLNQNLYFQEIKLESNYNLTINVGNSDKEIVVDHLNIKNGHINIIGSGKLKIYVKNDITLGSGSTINKKGDIHNLAIYLKGSGNTSSPKNVTLAGSQEVYGSLFAEDANIKFTAGSGFHGHIYTGGTSFIIDGGAYAYSKMIFAPMASFQLLAGATIKGSVISDSFYSSGGSKITFETIYDDDLIELPLPEDDTENEYTPPTEPISIISPIREK
ncbi:pilus assembly PilX N-terminal domain-containing protein [Fredinandcohnia quinoae]|uniref:Pilus assembly PilX N-terminal domain-containing protein n=1 Tax=Fredinandcohnia quinoae TaxID=2918902 RepID=A0AAW5E2I6_9BACI|nr:pilus assembly PilX N-terminal domain-containing protein [Fredinandcohnia sp. SECRCQ15]MCH1626578.1 pilus assembly PilX N-terminal domain-containing protein [Fredinandcohnia sp. SECRCQ15]